MAEQFDFNSQFSAKFLREFKESKEKVVSADVQQLQMAANTIAASKAEY